MDYAILFYAILFGYKAKSESFSFSCREKCAYAQQRQVQQVKVELPFSLPTKFDQQGLVYNLSYCRPVCVSRPIRSIFIDVATFPDLSKC